MEEQTKIKIYLILIGIVLLVGGFFAGYYYHDYKIFNDLSDSVKICEDNQQVLRVYETGFGKDRFVRVECFGELPGLDMHVSFE